MSASEDATVGGDAHAVDLRLRLNPGEPLSGRLDVEGQDGSAEFSGWIELIAAVNAARGTTSTSHE